MSEETINLANLEDEESTGTPQWVVTFSDLMSLLLCFFVLMLSFSEMDRAKYKEVAGSMEKAFGVQRDTPAWDSPKGTSIIARAFDREFKIVQAETAIEQVEITERLDTLYNKKDGKSGHAVEIQKAADKVVIRLMGEATFESGKAVIRGEMHAVLRDIGAILNSVEGEIVVAGHTDNVPVGTGDYRNNLALSIARAQSVAAHFIDNRILSEDRVVTMGFGESRPIESNATKWGRQRNRRVEIILTQIPAPLNPAKD